MLPSLPTWLRFASDAAIVAVGGVGLLLAALTALLMDRRRHRRDRIGAADRVGWVPWTGLFLLCATLGTALIAAALPALLARG